MYIMAYRMLARQNTLANGGSRKTGRWPGVFFGSLNPHLNIHLVSKLASQDHDLKVCFTEVCYVY